MVAGRVQYRLKTINNPMAEKTLPKQRDWSKTLRALERVRVTSALHYRCRAPLFGPMHQHASLFHISYVVAGAGRAVLDDREFDVMPGMLVYVRPRQDHASIGDDDHEYELIEIKWSCEDRAAERAMPDLPTVSVLARPEAFISGCQRVIAACPAPKGPNNWLSRARLAELLMVIDNETAPRVVNDEVQRQVEMAVEHIRTRFIESITVSQLAEMAGLSTSHFAAVFRQRIGVSPIELLLRMRLNAARDLLATTRLPIKQVARLCGFHSPQYFATLFARRTGQSPLAYRRRAVES